MPSRMIKGRHEAAQTLRSYRHPSAHSHGDGYIDFVKVDGQRLAIPVKVARADAAMACTALQLAAATFGHGPAFARFSIQRDIDGAVVFWVSHAPIAGTCPSIVGRKHTTHKGDDGQSILPVVAQRVDIPPEITTRRDRLVESRCAIRVAAASRPDMAAMGKPGPGCTLPPAKYRPGTLLRADGRANADIQPCVA